MSQVKARQGPVPKRRLEHADLISILLSERDVRVSDAHCAQADAEAKLFGMQVNQELERRQKLVMEAVAKRDADRKRHQQVVNDLAARYVIDWTKTAFDPLTGDIKTLPPQD